MLFEQELMNESDAKKLNPQVLAFIGDGVYSLYIRHKIILKENIQGRDLHLQVINYVKAKGQSNFIDKLLPVFDETEMSDLKEREIIKLYLKPRMQI